MDASLSQSWKFRFLGLSNVSLIPVIREQIIKVALIKMSFFEKIYVTIEKSINRCSETSQ